MVVRTSGLTLRVEPAVVASKVVTVVVDMSGSFWR
jgi:hypothetical protein